MAYITIPQLPPGGALTGLEVFESVQSSTSVKLTANQIKSFVSTNPTLTVSDAATNTVSTAATLVHTTTNTAAPGFGTALAFESENDSGSLVIGTSLQSIETDPTATLEFFDFAIRSIVGGTQTEVARFTSAFELGVGTSTPAATFHGVSQDLNINGVTSVVRADHTTLSGAAGNGIGSAIEFGVENDAGVTKVGASMDAVAVSVASGAENFDLVFNLMNSGAPMSEVMRMTYTGNVGIGTDVPNSRLEVFLSDANIGNAVAVSRFTHATSGVPVAGIGTGVEFVTETSSNNYEIGGSIYTESTSIAATLEDFDMAFAVMVDGNPNVEAMRITSDKFLGINTSTPSTSIQAVLEDAATTTATPMLRLTHTTSNTPGVGFGSGIEFQTETLPNGNLEVGGVIESVIVDPTAAVEGFDLVFKTMTAGAPATEKLRVGDVIYTPQPFGAGTVPDATAWVHTGAGTALSASIGFDPGTLLTTPYQGAMEFDGRNLFITPFGLQRSVFNAPQVFQLESDRTAPDILNSTAVQSIFGKAVGVNDNTRYQFQINATFRATSATAKNIGFAVGGSAVINVLDYESSSFFAAATTTVTASYMMGVRKTSAFTTVQVSSIASGAAAGFFTLRIRGSIDVVTAGTLDFSFNYSAAPTVGTVQAGSSMWLWATGPIGVDTSIGDWT